MKAPFFRSALLIAVTSLFFSCQKDVSGLSEANALDSKAAVSKKESKKYNVKGSLDTYTNFFPDKPAGWVAPNGAPGWYPGGGEGNLSHLGKLYIVVNQYATPVLGKPGEATGVSVPLTALGVAELNKYGIEVPGDVPASIGTVFFDKQGNTIWANASYYYKQDKSIPGSVTSGTFFIVDGTGKFSGIRGSLHTYAISRIVNYGAQPPIPAALQEHEISGVIWFVE